MLFPVVPGSPRAGYCLKTPREGGVCLGPWPAPADPPIFLGQKIYQRGRKFQAHFRYTNFFLASDPPPPGVSP